MRFASWTAALTLIAACAIAAPVFVPLDLSAARADDASDKRAQARSALADLASADEAVRAKGVAELVELKRFGAVELALRGADLNDRAWHACAEAFVGAKRSECALCRRGRT